MTDYFNYTEQRFQTAVLGDNLVVLSALGCFSVGNHSESYLDLSGSSSPNLSIYCNDLMIQSPIHAEKIQVGCYQVTTQAKGAFSADGTDGNNGGPTIPAEPGKKVAGANGEEGKPAGIINVALLGYQDSSYGTPITAVGGNGGNGQSAIGGTGGNGGNGGKGGKVNIIYNLQAPVVLSRIMALASPYSNDQVNSLINLTLNCRYPDLSIESNALGRLRQQYLKNLTAENEALNKLTLQLAKAQDNAKAAIKKKIDQLIERIADTKASFQAKIDNNIGTIIELLISTAKLWPSNVLKPRLNVSGGKGGTFGTGTNAGDNGSNGNTGTISEIGFKPSNFAAGDFPFVPVHPVQASMELAQLELAYYVQTFNNGTDIQAPSINSLQSGLTALAGKTTFANALAADSPLYQLYNDEKTATALGFLKGIATLQSVNNRANALLAQQAQGLDFYGNKDNSVPLLSFTRLDGFYSDFYQNFADIENAYNQYFQTEIKLKKTTRAIKNNLDKADSLVRTAQSQLNTIVSASTLIANNIVSLTQQVTQSKKQLDQAIRQVIKDIQNEFDYDWDRISNALSLISTFSDSALDGIKSVVSDVNNGLDSISTQAGDRVDKSLVIRQIQTIEDNIDSLKTGYSILDNGKLSPGTGVALLATDEKELTSLLDKYFSPKFKDYQAVKSAFDNYINIVVKRNNAIAYYNAKVMAYIKYSKLIDKYKGLTGTYTKELLASLSPDFPDLVQFMSEVYLNARSIMLELLYQMQRAYEFYAVELSPVLPGDLTNPPQIDAAAIRSFHTALLQKYKNAENARGKDAEKLTDNKVTLSANELATLLDSSQVVVNIPVDTDVFIDKADIRLTQVGFYITGIKPKASANTTSGDPNALTVKLTQSGSELIVPATGPASIAFVHEPISVLFQYDVVTGKILDNGQIGGSSGKYTGIGPFSDWTIKIANPENFSFSDVTAANFSFQGSNFTRG